jgi:hypothetical protein
MQPSERLRRARRRIALSYVQGSFCVSRRGEPVLPTDEGVWSFTLLGALEADGLGTEYQQALQMIAQVCPWWLPRACLRRKEDEHLVEPALWAWGELAKQQDVVAAVDKAIARAIALERKGNA